MSFPPLKGRGCPIQGCESCSEDMFVVPEFAGRRELKEARAYCPHQGCHKEPSLAKCDGTLLWAIRP